MARMPAEGRIVKSGRWLVRNDGNGYGTRARLVLSPATAVIIVEWCHPNAGYWADAGVLIKGAHMKGWEAFPIAGWMASTEQVKQLKERFKELLDQAKLDVMARGNGVLMPEEEK